MSNGYAEFIRVPKPKPVKYQVATGNHRYGWVGNAVADIWELREMTEEEKAEIDLWEKIQSETE